MEDNRHIKRENEPLIKDSLQESPWSCRRIVILVSLCMVFTLVCGTASILGPFFPTEAQERGVSDFVTGIIFGSYSFTVFLLASISGWLIPKYGAPKVLIGGLMMCSVSLCVSGACQLLLNPVPFSVLILLLRILSAIGAAASETSTMSIALDEFPDNMGTVSGVLETFAGVGFAVGPAFGGILYTAGGFKLPFIGFGIIMAALIPIIFLSLSKKQEAENANQEEVKNSSLIQTLKIPGVFILALCYVNVGALYSFISPILAPHLNNLVKLNASEIALFFFVQAFCYASLAPFIGWIVDKTRCYRWMIMVGFIGAGVSCLFLGPAPFLLFILPARELWPIWVGMAFIGTFSCCIYVALIPELKNTVSKHGMTDNSSTNGIISGIFCSMTNLGMTIGPILGGTLYQHNGFQWATAVDGLICIAQGLIVIAFVAIEKLVQREKSTDNRRG